MIMVANSVDRQFYTGWSFWEKSERKGFSIFDSILVKPKRVWREEVLIEIVNKQLKNVNKSLNQKLPLC